MARILDGEKVAEEVCNGLVEEVKELKEKPELTVFLIGNDPASQIYVEKKEEKAKQVGVKINLNKLAKTTTEKNLINRIKQANRNESVNGVLVQLPLPEHINQNKILETVSPKKDVDGFHPLNQGKLLAGNPDFIPAAPKGIIEILDYYEIPVKGKRAVVIGASSIVGKPTSLLLLEKGATPTICHIYTKNLSEHTRKADILISAVGKPRLVKKNMVKQGSTVIDVGVSRKDNEILGDVDFENVRDKVNNITPVPGGVGPLTVSMLLKNVVKAVKQQSGKHD